MAQNNNIKPSEISQVLLQQLKDIDTSLRFEEIGKVLQVSDGVARMYGLANAEAGELLEFESGVILSRTMSEPFCSVLPTRSRRG